MFPQFVALFSDIFGSSSQSALEDQIAEMPAPRNPPKRKRSLNEVQTLQEEVERLQQVENKNKSLKQQVESLKQRVAELSEENEKLRNFREPSPETPPSSLGSSRAPTPDRIGDDVDSHATPEPGTTVMEESESLEAVQEITTVGPGSGDESAAGTLNTTEQSSRNLEIENQELRKILKEHKVVVTCIVYRGIMEQLSAHERSAGNDGWQSEESLSTRWHLFVDSLDLPDSIDANGNVRQLDADWRTRPEPHTAEEAQVTRYFLKSLYDTLSFYIHDFHQSNWGLDLETDESAAALESIAPIKFSLGLLEYIKEMWDRRNGQPSATPTNTRGDQGSSDSSE